MRSQEHLPNHLIQMPGNEWALWRWVGLRGAGFPSDWPSRLAAPACAGACDHLIQVEEEKERARNDALKALRQELESSGIENRDCLINAIRRLKRDQLPGPLNEGCDRQNTIQEFSAVRGRLFLKRDDFQNEFKKEIDRISNVLCEAARDRRFREAILWQNRRALHTGVDALLKKQDENLRRGSKQRQYEELIANYLQRYCLKNDTIGFFGPVGWAEIVPDDSAVSAKPGPGLLAERNVYFEVWGIDALAETLTSDQRMRPWVVPRRMHFVHLVDSILYLPSREPVKLGPRQVVALNACDGERTAKEIAHSLVKDVSTGMTDEQEVYALFHTLQEMGLISWKLEVPMEIHPERSLRSMLERIGDAGLRASSLASLNELEEARDAVREAAGDDEKLDRCLGNLENSFKRLTGFASTRSAGKTYAARTLIYEDCRRDIEVNIGSRIVESLGPPLSLLLTSARWFTFEVAKAYSRQFEGIYAEQVEKSGASDVDFAGFWYRVQPLLFGDNKPHVDKVLAEFQRLWSRVLTLPEGCHRVGFDSRDLRSRVLAMFNAPEPGWPYACYHSPDVMIAARSIEDIEQGKYQLVMGELHMAANTLAWPLFMAQHPSPEKFFQAIALDLPDARLEPVIPKLYWPGQTARLLPALFSPRDFRLEISSDPPGVPGARVLPIGSLVIKRCGGRLVIETRDGRLQFGILDAFAHIFTLQVASRFDLLPPAPYTPRVNFDRLVVCRESWRFSPQDMQFAYEKDETERFIAARRWGREHNLPGKVFVKVPIERKPFFVDFESYVYINIFAKMVRRTREIDVEGSAITVSEMLPEADQTWLTDAEGRRYTSELRMVAVDLDSYSRTALRVSDRKDDYEERIN